MGDNKHLWDNALLQIQQGLNNEEQFNNWFRPVVFESFDQQTGRLLLQIPARSYSEHIEKHYLKIFSEALMQNFGKNVSLNYRIVMVKHDNTTVVETPDMEMVPARRNASQKQSPLPEIDSQLDIHLNFSNFIEGDSNRLSRSVGLNVAEHPKSTKFNPMFIYGPSGCGKTHLINAIGVRAKEIYPQLRVLYVSARTFQQQFTTAIQKNNINDFIAFYQTIDMLIVDDIQEWSTQEKTQDTFFHIFDYLFRRSKRIILASDRSPAQLRGMHERLITRFACGVTCEVERPNVKLCMDILRSKTSRDGITISDDVLQYISENVNGSVRDLQGVINSLMVYSIVDNSDIDMHLAERIIKRVVRIDNEQTVNLDNIMDAVCEQFKFTPQDINGKSRKKDLVQARHVVMYLAQKLTKMPASRIGRLVGGRDHSTAIHAYRKITNDLKTNKALRTAVETVEKAIKG